MPKMFYAAALQHVTALERNRRPDAHL